MSDAIMNTENDILKMLVFNPDTDAVILKISGKKGGNYQVTPVTTLDSHLKTCPPEHLDILLDARNYLYKKDVENVDEPTA